VSDENPYKPPSAEVPAVQGSVALEGASVTAAMLDHLKATRPWVRFISVAGFIGSGLTGAAALVMAIAAVAGAGGDLGGMAALFGMALYIGVIAAVYLLPTIRLNRYAGALGRVFSQGGAASIEEALSAQASFWRLAGILLIIGLGLAALAVMGIGAAGVVAAVTGGFD
jgi:hypothetical protein